MEKTKTQGIVLRHYNFSETSLVVIFFTEQSGKIKTVVKGAKRPKGRFFGRLELCSILDLMLQHSSRSELHALTDVSIVDTLEPLRMDLAKFAHAMVILELLDAAFEVESPHPDFYADLVLGLRTLAYKPMDLAIPLLIQLKMLNALGLLPAESDCQECGKALEGPFYFSFQRGASLCKPCVGNAKAMGIVSGNTWQIPYLESVANKSLQECLDIPIPQDKKRQFFGWIRNILDGVVHKKIRSYDFLSQVGF